MCALQRKRQISVLIIVFLIVSSIYFADIKAASDIMSHNERDKTNGLYIKENSKINQELCSDEVSGMGGLDGVRVYERHTLERTDTRAEMILLSVKSFLTFSVLIAVIKRDGLNQKICRSRFVIDYIHQKDGEKGSALLYFHMSSV